MKKRKSIKKLHFLHLNKLSFLKQRKALLVIPIIIVVSIFFLNSQFLKSTIQTVFAADLSAIVASSGTDINLTPGDYTFSEISPSPPGKLSTTNAEPLFILPTARLSSSTAEWTTISIKYLMIKILISTRE